MVKKRYWKGPIDEFVKILNRVKGEEKIETVEVMGTLFEVLPGVFSPVHSSDTAWFAEKMIPMVKGKRFLEIGSGSGVIACLAAKNGAGHVTATDINPDAVKNIHLNAKLHSLNISIKQGSVFEPIGKEIFDVIFWNHPFYCFEESDDQLDMLMSSVYDADYQHLRSFFEKGKSHLNENGCLVLGTSNVARLKLIMEIAASAGFKAVLLDKLEVPVYKDKKVKMDVRVYQFSMK